MRRQSIRRLLLLLLLVFFAVSALYAETGNSVGSDGQTPWWMWSLGLFIITFLLGMLAVLAGVGGGSVYVPAVAALFPFNLDFVRGAGLIVALTSAIAAGPRLLKSGLASLRLSMPLALVSSLFSILGALVGLSVPQNIVQAALGVTMMVIVVVMVAVPRNEFAAVREADALSARLGIHGVFQENQSSAPTQWKIKNTPVGAALFMVIGFMAGMFGLGAGWANIPVLNLVLGAPLKIAVGTSSLILSVNASAAAWVYLHRGAVLPLVAVPSAVGMMLGSRIGARLLTVVPSRVVRWVVIAFLLLAGLRSLLAGTGVWM